MIDPQILNIITVLSTVILVVATVIYAGLTYLLVRETRKSVEVSARVADEARRQNDRMDRLDKPSIQFVLEPGKHRSHLFEMAISNVGGSPAHDVKIDTPARGIPYYGHDQAGRTRAWENVSLFDETIPVLYPRQEIRTGAFNLRDIFKWKPDLTILEFTITFKDEAGAEYSNTIRHNMSVHRNLMDYSAKNFTDLVTEVEKIAKTLDAIKRSSGAR